MTTQHTPGPWEIYRNGYDIRQAGSAIFLATAITSKDYRSDDEAKANASLIAAAPDLLAALELALDDLQLVSDENGGSHGRTLDKIIDAIAKAKGKDER